MNKIKVGDYVKITGNPHGYLEDGFRDMDFKVMGFNKPGKLIIDTIKAGGNDHWKINLENVEKVNLTDLEYAQEGDIIYGPESKEYSKILGRCGRILFITSWYGNLEKAQEDIEYFYHNTIDIYKKDGCTIYVPEEKLESGIFSDMNIVVDKFMEDIEDFKNKLTK